MAKIQILDVVNDKVEIKNLSDPIDVFINYNKKYSRDYSFINIDVFLNDLLNDNGNFHVYDVSLTSSEDDISIKVFSVYVENKDGCHICCKKYNVIVINKDLYYSSGLEKYFVEYYSKIEAEKEYKKSELQTLSYEIREYQDRIMPKTCQYIDDTINNKEISDIDKYHITYEEVAEYVKNNRNYIRDYIKENWKNLGMFKRVVGITGTISIAVAIYLLMSNKYGVVLTTSAYIYFVSTIMYLSSQLAVERKMDSYVNLAPRAKRVRKNNS